MKARCIYNMKEPTVHGMLRITQGSIEDYTKNDIGDFIVRGYIFKPHQFFAYFAPIDSDDKMSYSDFFWILINKVFPEAIGEELDGKTHIRIRDQFRGEFHFIIDKEKMKIYIRHGWSKEYQSYEEALIGIRDFLTAKVEKKVVC